METKLNENMTHTQPDKDGNNISGKAISRRFKRIMDSLLHIEEFRNVILIPLFIVDRPPMGGLMLIVVAVVVESNFRRRSK